LFPKLYFYSLGVWVLFIIPAILNGIARGIYAPYTDELLIHQISSVILCTGIFAVTYVFLKHSGVSGISRQFIYIGLIWLRLLYDYNIFEGRIWLLVLVVTATSPWLANRIIGVPTDRGSK